MVDVWSLRGEARIPPLVVLSACDTHAVDGSHATVANGLIACGAKAVLATFLPVRSVDSSALVARLALRARTFVQLLNRGGQSVSWARVVTFCLRAQLITDVLRRLMAELDFSREEVLDLCNTATARVNFGLEDWWELFKGDLSLRTGWETDRMDQFLQEAIAESDVIRYVHVGMPETVVLSSLQVFDDLAGRRRAAR